MPAALVAAASRQPGGGPGRRRGAGRRAVVAAADPGSTAPADLARPGRRGAVEHALFLRARYRLRPARRDARHQTDGAADTARRTQPARLRAVRALRHLPPGPGPGEPAA